MAVVCCLRELFLLTSSTIREYFLFVNTFSRFFSCLRGDSMSLKERIKSLAQDRGISLPALEAELGFGNSTIVKWDKSIPNADKLNTVAKYFGVSMDYLLNGIDNDGLNEKDNKDITKDLNNIMEKLSSGEAGPASFNGEELDPEAAELFRDELEIALRRLKIINKEKYTPKKYKK